MQSTAHCPSASLFLCLICLHICYGLDYRVPKASWVQRWDFGKVIGSRGAGLISGSSTDELVAEYTVGGGLLKVGDEGHDLERCTVVLGSALAFCSLAALR